MPAPGRAACGTPPAHRTKAAAARGRRRGVVPRAGDADRGDPASARASYCPAGLRPERHRRAGHGARALAAGPASPDRAAAAWVRRPACARGAVDERIGLCSPPLRVVDGLRLPAFSPAIRAGASAQVRVPDGAACPCVAAGHRMGLGCRGSGTGHACRFGSMMRVPGGHSTTGYAGRRSQYVSRWVSDVLERLRVSRPSRRADGFCGVCFSQEAVRVC